MERGPETRNENKELGNGVRVVAVQSKRGYVDLKKRVLDGGSP